MEKPPRKVGKAMSQEELEALPVRRLVQEVRKSNRSDYGGQNRRKKIAETLPESRDDESLVEWFITNMARHREGTAKRQGRFLKEIDRRYP